MEISIIDMSFTERKQPAAMFPLTVLEPTS